jgi:parallel beta-helix repeat protein
MGTSGGSSGGGLNQYTYNASGGDDTTAINALLALVVASGKASQVSFTGTCLVSGSVSLNNSTATITLTGPGMLYLENGAAANSWILRISNSPNITIRGLAINQNGTNQTNRTFGIYYDTNSSNLLVSQNIFYEIKAFAFMSDGGGPTVRTYNVNFTDNLVLCAANSNDDIVVLVADGGAASNNVVTGVASGMGISLYESNQCVATGNTVTLTGATGEGICIASSTGCTVAGNSVWGGTNDVCYQAFQEVDNGNARTQTDALFVGNHAGEYPGAVSPPAAYAHINASNTNISGGTSTGCWTVLLTTGTNGAVMVNDVLATGYTYTSFNSSGTTTPAPVLNNVGSAPATFATVPATVGTCFTPAVGAPSNINPVANLLYVQKIFIPFATTLTGIAVGNNSNQTGNVLVALYSSTGTEVAHSVSTAGSGGYESQPVPFTATYAAPAGVYYIAIMFSSATALVNTNEVKGPSNSAAQGSFALPSTITPPGTFTTTPGSYPEVGTY